MIYSFAKRNGGGGGGSTSAKELKALSELPQSAADGAVVAVKGSSQSSYITIKKEDWVAKPIYGNGCPILDSNGLGLVYCEFWGDVNFGWDWKDYQDIVTAEWSEYEQNGTTIRARYDKDGEGVLYIEVVSGDYTVNPLMALITNDPTLDYDWTNYEDGKGKIARIELKEQGGYLIHTNDNNLFVGGDWDGSNFNWGYGQLKDENGCQISGAIKDGFIVGISSEPITMLDAYGTSSGLHENGTIVKKAIPTPVEYGVYQAQGSTTEMKYIGGSMMSLYNFVQERAELWLVNTDDTQLGFFHINESDSFEYYNYQNDIPHPFDEWVMGEWQNFEGVEILFTMEGEDESTAEIYVRVGDRPGHPISPLDPNRMSFPSDWNKTEGEVTTTNWVKVGKGGGSGSINDAGDELNPIYIKDGEAIACGTSVEGKYWGIVPKVRRSDGGMEIGTHIDFHESGSEVKDYDSRIISKNGVLYGVKDRQLKKILLDGDGGYSIVDELPTKGRAMGDAVEEGQMAWLKTEYEDVTATELYANIPMDWSHIGSFKRVSDDREIFPLGFQGNEDGGVMPRYFVIFSEEEGFLGDGEWHIRVFDIDGEAYLFHYNWVTNSRAFAFFWDSDNIVFEMKEEVVDAFTKNEVVIPHKVREGAQFTYSEEFGWMHNVYDLDSMTNEERVALAREAAGYINNKQKPFPYPIIWRYGDKCYRAASIGACFDGTENSGVEGCATNPDNGNIIRVFTSADGALNYEERSYAYRPQVFYLYENMEGYEYMEAFNQISYNCDENGMYRGDATFYMKDPYFHGRVKLTHIVNFGSRIMLGGMFEANGSVYWAQVNLWHNEDDTYTYEYAEKTIFVS